MTESPRWGAYGIMVITGDCGSLNMGSIPIRHPYGDFFCDPTRNRTWIQNLEGSCFIH